MIVLRPWSNSSGRLSGSIMGCTHARIRGGIGRSGSGYERQGKLHPITRMLVSLTIREERSAPLLLIRRQQCIPCDSKNMSGSVMRAWSRHFPPCVVERPILELIRTAVCPYYHLFTLSVILGNGEGVINDE